MKPYHKNPRQITSKQLSQLQSTLRELGDLSGIVHDVNSDEIIGGNQRGRVFDVNRCEVVVEHSFDEPDEQGTVALGYVIWEGKRYSYRAVSWTAEQCEKANIVANKAGGSWDFDVLANEFDVDDLLSWGFDEHELGLDGDDWLPEAGDAAADDVDAIWGVVIDCADEDEQIALLERMLEEGYKCRALIS